jgi:hypothetical protein
MMVAFEIEVDGQMDAPVPLHSFGARLAYRQSVIRRWIILELEMLLGDDRFLARPVTF